MVIKHLLIIACLSLFFSGCDMDRPVVVMEQGDYGFRYHPEDEVMLDQGNVLWVHFVRIHPDWSGDSTLTERMKHIPVKIVEGSSSVRIIPDVDSEHWFIMGTKPGRAVIRAGHEDDETFEIHVREQPSVTEDRPDVEIIDAGD